MLRRQIRLCHNPHAGLCKHAAVGGREHAPLLGGVLDQHNRVRVGGRHHEGPAKIAPLQILARCVNHTLVDNLYGLGLVVLQFLVVDPLAKRCFAGRGAADQDNASFSLHCITSW